jgi:ferric-dicitrate binding protein FerR (iron transport regulator)
MLEWAEWAEWGNAPNQVATIELVRGDVYSGGASAALGSALSAGSVLETGEEASGAALRLRGTQSVRLDTDTRVRLISDSSFELERGAVYIDTQGAAPGAGIEISTAFGVVRDIGTQFLVRLGEGDAELTVRVREGEVRFEGRSAGAAARAGQELTLYGDSNAVEVGAVEPYGDAWRWIEVVTPTMDIEGASLSDYLDWVSRETGRELRYADGALARSARTIILSGSIENLTPEESLAILPGSGLGSRVENGLLLIEQPAD